jgi:hypothetical protein
MQWIIKAATEFYIRGPECVSRSKPPARLKNVAYKTCNHTIKRSEYSQQHHARWTELASKHATQRAAQHRFEAGGAETLL